MDFCDAIGMKTDFSLLVSFAEILGACQSLSCSWGADGPFWKAEYVERACINGDIHFSHLLSYISIILCESVTYVIPAIPFRAQALGVEFHLSAYQHVTSRRQFLMVFR